LFFSIFRFYKNSISLNLDDVYWKRTNTEMAINPDLWEQLLQLCTQHQVKFVWIQGHAGNLENERCNQLAISAAQQSNLPSDEQYEMKCQQ